MNSIIKIGTRDSELAVWQADLVKEKLSGAGYKSELVMVNSDGDADQETPLYEMGVQGIFTRSLDVALINNSIDVAVHSMKDVPTQLPAGIVQAAVLERGNYKDLFVINNAVRSKLTGDELLEADHFLESLATNEDIQLDPVIHSRYIIGTSSIRRKAQWLHRYPGHKIENLRGNMNTRVRKIEESYWDGAILAAAGLERINLRPSTAIELDWMLPAPAQGAIMVVCRAGSENLYNALQKLNHKDTEICTRIEKDFLRALMGGCSTPISALARMDKDEIYFKGSILSPDGKEKIEVEKYSSVKEAQEFGLRMGLQLLSNGGREIADKFHNGK